MRFSCFHADPQERGDILRGPSFGNELQDLPFPGRKRIGGHLGFRAVGFHHRA